MEAEKGVDENSARRGGRRLRRVDAHGLVAEGRPVDGLEVLLRGAHNHGPISFDERPDDGVVVGDAVAVVV